MVSQALSHDICDFSAAQMLMLLLPKLSAVLRIVKVF